MIRFRKWSRKAYAAFASIGKCVTIGHVSKSIADNSLSKRETAISPIASVQNLFGDIFAQVFLQTWGEAEWELPGITVQTVLHPTSTAYHLTIDHSHKYISKNTCRHALPDISNTPKCMPVLF